MWSPTHIQVTVQKARGLPAKGKNGTNNCFVTIAMGKEKYQTSIKEKATGDVDWHEECELAIPDRGNRAELVLTCLHRNKLGLDQFIGQVTLPLNELDDDRPRTKWYKLVKQGQEKEKYRGELEVRTMFTVVSGSLSDLSKKEKHKSSIGQLASSVGGSLLSLGALEKRKGLKKFAKSLGSKMHISGKSKKNKDVDNDSYTGSFTSIGTPNNTGNKKHFGQTIDDADPGVLSEDEDEFVFDNLSHKSSGSSLNVRSSAHHRVPSPEILSKEDLNLRSKTLPPIKPPRTASEQKLDEWEVKLYGKHMDIGSSDSLKRRSWENSRVPLPKKEEDVVEQVQTFIEQEQKVPTPVMNRSQPSESVVAPSTPNLKEKELNLEDIAESDSESAVEGSPVFEKVDKFDKADKVDKVVEKPQPLPRSNTLPSIIEAVPPPSSPKQKPSSNESSPNPSITRKDSDKSDKTEKKRFSKLKYFRKDKTEALEEVLRKPPPKQFGERIIIGHENNFAGMGSVQSELSQDVLKKYEGKSREEVMLIADNLESQVSMQRQRVKELEDYLDNLLVRVMETHPKILQNPYTRTSSTKSG